MPSKSKSSGSSTAKNRTLAQFDRGPTQIRNYFPKLTESESITLQIQFMALLEILSLNLTNNDTSKSRWFLQSLVHLLTSSKMLPAAMFFPSISFGQTDLGQSYVRNLRVAIQAALNRRQQPSPPSSPTTDGSMIINNLEQDFSKALFARQPPSSNISIDIPQPDIQLKMPLPLTMSGTIATNDFDNVVVFRYVKDFYEHNKIGKGAFGAVFRAKNLLDDRMYAIKKIIFNENTDRTRRQAKSALREVRVLAALSHPNIVQYHCAWIELVPVETRAHRTPPSSTTTLIKRPLPPVEQSDSIDKMIEFQRASSISSQNTKEKHDTKSSSTSLEEDEDGFEMSVFGTDNNQNSSLQCHSDGANSSSKQTSQHSISNGKVVSNKQLVPLHTRNQTFHTRNQTFHPIFQSQYTASKIVLFIQMQLCDKTLHDWLRYRDERIINETSDENRCKFYSLNDLGQHQCCHIFKQLLTAVEYLHSQSYVHRDIKPRNIFLLVDSKDPSYLHVKLGDFGLATLFESALPSGSADPFNQNESSGVGTALYAPPEQLNSNRCIATAKSDSYSLGIVLYELFNIFPTETGRIHCLNDLRVHMKVDENFSKHYPFETNLIEKLVSIESEKRPSVEEILTIYGKEIHQRMKKQQNNTKQMMIDKLQETVQDQAERIQQLELQLEKNRL